MRSAGDLEMSSARRMNADGARRIKSTQCLDPLEGKAGLTSI